MSNEASISWLRSKFDSTHIYTPKFTHTLGGFEVGVDGDNIEVQIGSQYLIECSNSTLNAPSTIEL